MKPVRSIYIHIPFCKNICAYCDFCKLQYQSKWISSYLHALDQEIKSNYRGEVVETIYIGGGTPSVLSLLELKELFQILKQFHTKPNYEYTIECNVDSLTEEKIILMHQYGINRVSIGVETFQKRHLIQMCREFPNRISYFLNLFRKYQITNINLDLIYALPDETLEELKQDLDQLLLLKVPHISTYSLMIEPHTIFGIEKIQPIEEELDLEMYQYICQTLKKHGYQHYEISNFSKEGFVSKHNLTYWNNYEYYGFGLGASGYIDKIRYTNTKSLLEYEHGNYCFTKYKLSKREMMENEMILGLRKRKGVSIASFQIKYKEDIYAVFPIASLLKTGKLCRKNGFLSIPEKYFYISNEVLIELIE